MIEFNKIFEYKNNENVCGLTNELSVFFMLNYFLENNEDVLIVTNSLFEATKLFNSFQTYTEDVLLFPMDDFLTSVVVAESPDLKYTRLETLKQIKLLNKKIIVTNLMGYLKLLPNVNEIQESTINVNSTMKRSSLIELLDKFGYKRESLVTSTGEFSYKGTILDVFLIHENKPIRIEFDGDEIDKISYFNEETQLTDNEITSISINPIIEISTTLHSSILDYMLGSNVFFIDYSQLKVAYEKVSNDIVEYEENNISSNEIHDFLMLNPKFSMNINFIDNFDCYKDYESHSHLNYNEDFNKLVLDYKKFKNEGKDIYFYLSMDGQVQKISSLINDVKIINKKINNGFITDSVVVFGENDIGKINKSHKQYKSTYKFGKKIKSYDSLEKGDYVVHITHGVGVYSGIKSLSKNGVMKDYVQILYNDDGKIYIPVEKISTIYKYSDKDGTAPNINSLGSIKWKKTRSLLQKKLVDISAELIELYKLRLNIKTLPYSKYLNEDKIFDDAFPHTLTDNQERSVGEILKDLYSEYPMDRLLCGDVGFGKTEVAFRGIFNTVLNNKQVLYLCPTTILSNQQYKLSLERFKDWPIEIALLNRFVTPSKAREIISDYKNGKIDILFGTHRLLSNDIIPKDLGLLVVDEEQRFGVSHKEKIKRFKSDINVLSLSATPIPRTLKMALSGLRDLSVIDTAPVNRYPVQTYVISESDLIIRDAIYKELSRGGQTFILYNRVETIESKVSDIKKLVPDAEIGFAHGQMTKEQLENRMNDFIEGKYDVLICTTIIESGIDIPNANTLIVYDSDRFGLAQLYQIRGRVGRSNKIAYAYLLYNDKKILNETATKRLNAIKEFTELGSGYKIAMRDLAIRGAGDIFGSSQAGFIDSVGINLYLKMMDDEIKRQKGENVIEDEETNVLFDVETHISDDYINDEDIKIEVHNLINTVDSNEKMNDVINELENRFGYVPDNLIIYMYEEWFEKLAKKLNITRVQKNDRLVEITIPKDVAENIQGDLLLTEAFRINSKFDISYKSEQIFISLGYKNQDDHFIIYFTKLLDAIISE